MYPKLFFEYFREFETTDEVFVAMPFRGAEAEGRWNNVFQPAIEAVGLEPYRVDTRVVSDSILTDILDGINRASFVLVDLSGEELECAEGHSISGGTNANVAYEMGIANAVRLPEEVVVVRMPEDGTESEPPFDVRHIRYITLSPDDQGEAVVTISDALRNAQAELDRTRDRIVDRTLGLLDQDSIDIVRDHHESGVFNPWREETRGEDIDQYQRVSVPRLLDLGVLRAGTHEEWGTRLYVFTKLGHAVGSRLPELGGLVGGQG